MALGNWPLRSGCLISFFFFFFYFFFTVPGKAVALWNRAAWAAARLIVLSCGQVISELLILITLHYHRLP